MKYKVGTRIREKNDNVKGTITKIMGERYYIMFDDDIYCNYNEIGVQTELTIIKEPKITVII